MLGLGSLVWTTLTASIILTSPIGFRNSLEPIRRLEVQDNGEVVPFAVAARRALWRITQSHSVDRYDPVETVLSMMAHADYWSRQPIICIGDRTLRERLRLDASGGYASADGLKESALDELIPAVVGKMLAHRQLSASEKEAIAVYDRLSTLRRILEQEVYLVPAATTETAEWAPILRPDGYHVAVQMALKRNWSMLLDGIRRGEPAKVREASERLSALLRNLDKHAGPAEPARGFARLIALAGLLALLLAAGVLVHGSPRPTAGNRRAPEAPAPVSLAPHKPVNRIAQYLHLV